MKKQLTYLFTAAMLLSATLSHATGEAVFERKLAGARTGDAEAQYDVAYRYEKGRGVDEDEELALEWYKKAAGQGLAKAQYKVGTYYMKGIAVDEDPEQAKIWLQKSADLGYAPAQYQLGKLYAAPRGGRDYQMAVTWLQKARDNGYEPATRELNKVKRKLN
jgi:TPR repeat protein